MKYGVFISYSHQDAQYVSPIIQLIRAMRKDLVFQDTRELRPGKLWEPQLLEALNDAKILIVFWCRHSVSSPYVKKECETAIGNNKDILPLLLDDSRLTKELSAYQWIDLRNVIFHKGQNNSPRAMRASPIPGILLTLLVSFLIFWVGIKSFTTTSMLLVAGGIFVLVICIITAHKLLQRKSENDSKKRTINYIATVINQKLRDKIPVR